MQIAVVESHIFHIESTFKQFHDQNMWFSVNSQHLYLVSSICVYNVVQLLLSLFLLGLYWCDDKVFCENNQPIKDFCPRFAYPQQIFLDSPTPLADKFCQGIQKLFVEGLLFPAANFSGQNFIGSRIKLSVAWAINLTDLIHKNIGLLFTVKIYCQISVRFFQNSSFNWVLKRKDHFNFFPFLFLTCTLLNVQKIIGYF